MSKILLLKLWIEKNSFENGVWTKGCYFVTITYNLGYKLKGQRVQGENLAAQSLKNSTPASPSRTKAALGSPISAIFF